MHPDVGISKKAMNIMNSMICDVLENIAIEASRVAKCVKIFDSFPSENRYNKRETITSREIEVVVRNLFPGELATHAVAEGLKLRVLLIF